MMKSVPRIWEIDMLRGVAVVLMIIFHFSWNLSFFQISAINVFSLQWQAFARFIGTLFTFLLGLSLTLRAAYQPPERLIGGVFSRYALQRGAWIFGLGMVVTVATFIAVGEAYVRFGILHLLGLMLVLADPFVRWPAWVSLLSGVAAIIVGAYLSMLTAPFPWLTWLGVPPAGVMMVDYYPVLPWGGAALLGVAIGRLAYPDGVRRFDLPDLAGFAAVRGLRFLGRHSLLIYLVHQPLIIGLLLLLGLASFS